MLPQLKANASFEPEMGPPMKRRKSLDFKGMTLNPPTPTEELVQERQERVEWQTHSDRETQRALSILRSGKIDDAMEMLEHIEKEAHMVALAHHRFVLRRQPNSMDGSESTDEELQSRKVRFNEVLETREIEDETDRKPLPMSMPTRQEFLLLRALRILPAEN